MHAPSRLKLVANAIIVLVSLGLITVLVYVSGGATGVAVNLYYLPIIWAGAVFGDLGALFAVLVAGLLSGPFMPADVQATTPEARDQTLTTVVLRLLFFFVVGLGSSRVSGTLRRRAYEFQKLYEVAQTISSSLRLAEVLRLITGSAVDVMNVKACSIRLLDPERRELNIMAAIGLSDDYMNKGPVEVARSPLDQMVLDGAAMTVLDAQHDQRFQYPEEAAREGLSSVLTVPLRSKDDVLGVIRVYARSRRRFGQDEIALLEAFANQASVAIENASLYEDIRRNYFETVRALTIAIEARDPVTYGHSERITALASRFGERLGMNSGDLETLRFGAILHDIGKIGVGEGQLNGQAAGDDRVFYEMHPIIGRTILQPVAFLQTVVPVVLYHHERWDGKGFPEGLVGEAIPYLARLVAIVDAYDRLVNPGTGRTGVPVEEAFEEITAGAGTRFDPALVAGFRRLRLAEASQEARERQEDLRETDDE